MVSHKLEQLVNKLSVMDRPGLIGELHKMECDFRMDFTEEFLNSVSIERLRHIVLAASLHDHQKTKAAV